MLRPTSLKEGFTRSKLCGFFLPTPRNQETPLGHPQVQSWASQRWSERAAQISVSADLYYPTCDNRRPASVVEQIYIKGASTLMALTGRKRGAY